MESFTIIDGIAAAVIIFSAILAYSRGLVREVLAIIGWIAAAVVAYKFAEMARPMIAQVPVLDRFIADSCELGTIAGFATVFAVALVVFSLLTPLFASMVQRSVMGGLDQGLGFLFGALRGAVLVAIAFVVYQEIGIREGVPMVDNSRSIQVFSSLSGEMNSTMPDDAPGWVVARYEELVSTCAAPAQ